MNVYDAERMADILARRGLCRDGARRGGGPRRPQHLPYPREGGREGLFRTRARARLKRAPRRGRARDHGSSWRAASRRPRARDPAPRAGRRRRRGAAELSPPAGPAPARRSRSPASSTPSSRSRTSSTTCRRRRAPDPKRGVSAFLTVQEGCDKFCTFCVVPYTRGAEVSRPVAQVVAEAERLADAGVREITLIGQNVNAYHGEGPDGATWTLGRPAASSRRDPRHRAPALHDQPSARHGRRPDRGAPRSAGADALPAPAGAGGRRTASSPP